jgi:DNA repair ATPase RecN
MDWTDREARELRTALHKLAEQSLKTSRRLDDTYYSILEKVSSLRQTIGNLQELSGLTKELHETFQSDTKELAEDIHGQFEVFSEFEPQQEQVTALEERIRVGKEKAETLTTRLEEVKNKVDARAKLEAEWEATTSRKF